MGRRYGGTLPEISSAEKCFAKLLEVQRSMGEMMSLGLTVRVLDGSLDVGKRVRLTFPSVVVKRPWRPLSVRFEER